MSIRGIAALQAVLLLLTMSANAASRSNMMEIKVLDSETRALPLDNNGVPVNCEQVTFDAYCRATNAPQMTSTLLVQEGENPPFRIICLMDSKYSRCTPLSKGATFEARREKHGVTVYYVDDRGKARSQLYKLIDSGGKAVPAKTETRTETANAIQPVPFTPAATESLPAPTPVPPSASAGRVAPKASGEKVRCNFNSTPSGADITIDGSYVGNTPSEIGLTAGKHVVQIAMMGFDAWKRELTVGSDSAVNVTAVLQKTQP
ncbi:MAG: PEGA domain-containing protein [Terriglobales bacterium]